VADCPFIKTELVIRNPERLPDLKSWPSMIPADAPLPGRNARRACRGHGGGSQYRFERLNHGAVVLTSQGATHRFQPASPEIPVGFKAGAFCPFIRGIDEHGSITFAVTP